NAQRSRVDRERNSCRETGYVVIGVRGKRSQINSIVADILYASAGQGSGKNARDGVGERQAVSAYAKGQEWIWITVCFVLTRIRRYRDCSGRDGEARARVGDVVIAQCRCRGEHC